MDKEIMDNIDTTKGICHAFDPYRSRPEDFIKFIKKYGKTTYRSTLFLDFNNFNYKYFIVFFVEKGKRGQISAWGLCDRDASKEFSKRVKKKNDKGDPFEDAPYGFPGDKSENFKRVFYYKKIELLKNPHNCAEFKLINTGENISKDNLGILRTALYVEIPPEIFNEIKEDL